MNLTNTASRLSIVGFGSAISERDYQTQGNKTPDVSERSSAKEYCWFARPVTFAS